MTTLVYELARHPEWQEKLREESRALGTDHLEHEDLEKLPHHAMAIKEAQRIIAPVPALARYAVKDTEVLGHYVPKGTRLGVSTYFTMRMEEHWPDPDTFDPDRFAVSDKEAGRHPYAWMPFGGGVHKCIGMHFGNLEVTAALHQFLLRYEWSSRTATRCRSTWCPCRTPTTACPSTCDRCASHVLLHGRPPARRGPRRGRGRRPDLRAHPRRGPRPVHDLRGASHHDGRHRLRRRHRPGHRLPPVRRPRRDRPGRDPARDGPLHRRGRRRRAGHRRPPRAVRRGVRRHAARGPRNPLLRRLLEVEPDLLLPFLTVQGAPALSLSRAYLSEEFRRSQAQGTSAPTSTWTSWPRCSCGCASRCS